MISTINCNKCNAVISGDFTSNATAQAAHDAQFHATPDQRRQARKEERRTRFLSKLPESAPQAEVKTEGKKKKRK